LKKAFPYHQAVLKGKENQRTFSGEDTLQIAMPLGGIGAGSVCLNGQGGLQDFSIRHKPGTTALPDGHKVGDAAFALLHFKELNLTRLVEGPMPVGKIFDQGLKAQGYRAGHHEGLPRFRDCVFTGEYPFGYVKLSDSQLPLSVSITGFNPFIPLDDKDSGIPCALLEYTLENTSKEPVSYEFSYHLSHLAYGSDSLKAVTSRNEGIPGRGVYFYNREPEETPSFGSAALGVVGFEPLIKSMWFRGAWFDAVSVLWREVSEGRFQPNEGEHFAGVQGRNGGSILLKDRLAPGDKITFPIVITWYFPNVPYSVGGIDGETGDCCAEGVSETCWRPYYVTQWENAKDVLLYVCENYAMLRGRTLAFHRALFGSTLPNYVLDAVSANLAIMKSPTVLRQENGNLWAWEGCFTDLGCCPGSCTHVWNYAQAFPHLFPQLERTLREQELLLSMDENGHVGFRSALPDGPVGHDFHAAADGQLGGIMKAYREWQISGDSAWLQAIYPLVKRSLDYCITIWDPRHKGVLEEPHHNTYDIEFWGPDGMCTSFYLGALAAMAALAKDAGHPQDAPFYQDLALKGARYLDHNLFNGEYYYQWVTVDDLNNTSFRDMVEAMEGDTSEEGRLLKEEGPKYQYGQGCITDGVFGAWLALLCGVETPQNADNIRRNLSAIFKYNFKTSLWGHANPQRPGYAMGDEPGLLLCTWPKGDKPTLPFVYSDEVWTGVEYQVASHMIHQGMVEEGLTIVKAVRSRYDGRVRNPWNEYECGSYYARAMASYALLGALSGFRYSNAEKTLYWGPKLHQVGFRVFFSAASGWGCISQTENELRIEVEEGYLVVEKLVLDFDGKVTTSAHHLSAREGEVVVIPIPST
jgi:uncharacterized protein (DUF608 family)